jgi:hypothetical protein
LTYREYRSLYNSRTGESLSSLPEEWLVVRQADDLIAEFGRTTGPTSEIKLVNWDGDPSPVSVASILQFQGTTVHFLAGELESEEVSGFGNFYRWECEQMVPDGGDIVPSDQDPMAFLLGGAS